MRDGMRHGRSCLDWPEYCNEEDSSSAIRSQVETAVWEVIRSDRTCVNETFGESLFAISALTFEALDALAARWATLKESAGCEVVNDEITRRANRRAQFDRPNRLNSRRKQRHVAPDQHVLADHAIIRLVWEIRRRNVGALRATSQLALRLGM